MHRLLFVFFEVHASGIERGSGRGGHGHRIFGGHIESLADRRNRCGGDALGKIFVLDVGHVEGAQPALAHGGINVLAAQLQIEDVAGVLVAFLQLQLVFLVLAEIIGISDGVQVAAEDRLWLVALGKGHCLHALFAVGHPGKASEEVQEVGALQQKLRHPGVVITGSRDVAIGAVFRFRGAHGMRHKRAEGHAAETLSGNRLLAVVDPIATGILGTHHHRAGGADGRYFVSGDGAIDAQHVHVVAQHLKIVGRPVARHSAFVAQHGHALIGQHRQMAAKAGGYP